MSPATTPPAPARREWRRHPPGRELWAGLGIIGAYLAIALAAIVEFHAHLALLSENPAWIPADVILGPSWAHPFGILPAFGVDLATALWQATPWDLGIVVAILAIDAGLGALLGAIAGSTEGRWADTLITFVGDSFGAIPAAFLVVVVFAGLALVAPSGGSLPLFLLLFGLILWPTSARAVRDRVRVIAHAPYVEAARAAGARPRRILLRHLLPNALEPILAQLPIDAIVIFFVLSVFPWWACVTWVPTSSPPGFYLPTLPSFSPLPSPAFPEWGYLLGNGACLGILYPGSPVFWWMILFPLLAIVGLVIGIALTCDGLDRWLRRRG